VYDQRLAKQLLAPLPGMVVLVGKPVFRLSKELNREASQADYAGAVPLVSETDQVEGYIEACKAVERDISSCVMCLDLPVNTPDPESLLGLACRASPRLLLVEHTGTSEELLADEQFFAHGFRIIEKIEVSGSQRALYAYSLSDYKQAPDWLNARFWAHPERFALTD